MAPGALFPRIRKLFARSDFREREIRLSILPQQLVADDVQVLKAEPQVGLQMVPFGPLVPGFDEDDSMFRGRLLARPSAFRRCRRTAPASNREG